MVTRALSDSLHVDARALLLAASFAIVGCFPGAVADPTRSDPLAADSGAAMSVSADTGVIGIAFEPLRSRTMAGDAVPHMELTGLLFLPDNQGLLLWDKSGRLSHHALTPEGLVLLGELRLDGVYNSDDCGLISVALDPGWQANGYLYAAACSSATHSTVTRYLFRPGHYTGVNASATEVIRFGDASATKPWHNVGTIGFFPDALQSMWILVGEKALPERAQDLSTQLGSVLRIIPNREPLYGGYSPHPDNPFGASSFYAESAASPEIYAWGLRSPWRGAVDRLGRLWIGDVGDELEEINLVRGPGENFGWSAAQGGCHDAVCSGMRDPVVDWGRTADHRYRVEDPDATPAVLRVAWVGVPYSRHGVDPYRGFLAGATLVSDMCVGFVRAVAVDEDGIVTRDEHVGHLAGLSGAAQGPDGYLYVSSYGGCTSDSEGVGGRVLRVVPRGHTPEQQPVIAARGGRSLADEPLGPMPQQLSEAGVFEDIQARRPIARAVRYEPRFPLWTNGSDKERWLLLPAGSQVDNGEGSPWQFPIGTVFGKTITFNTDSGDEPVETRIMRQTSEGWDFYAYKWVGQDAELLSLERSISVPVLPKAGEQLWHAIPSRFECRACHESNASPIIGFDELRLNVALREEEATQLIELHAQGVLRHAPREAELPVADDPTTLAVLGYLHGNCAHCHNDSSRSMSQLSLRHTDALSQLIGMQTKGSGQVAGVRVQPGRPEDSVLYRSLITDGTEPELKAMPPLGVQRKDREGAALIEHWIKGLTSF